MIFFKLIEPNSKQILRIKAEEFFESFPRGKQDISISNQLLISYSREFSGCITNIQSNLQLNKNSIIQRG